MRKKTRTRMAKKPSNIATRDNPFARWLLRHKISTQLFAKSTKMSVGAVNKLRQGVTKEPRPAYADRIAKAYPRKRCPLAA